MAAQGLDSRSDAMRPALARATGLAVKSSSISTYWAISMPLPGYLSLQWSQEIKKFKEGAGLIKYLYRPKS